MNNRIRSLQILGCLDSRVGGPAYSVRKLAEYLGGISVQADIWTFNYPFRDCQHDLQNGAQHLILPDFFLSRYLAGWNPFAFQPLKEAVSTASIVHVHGLWIWIGKYARVAAVQESRPLVISPRGMLERWALKRSVLKKKIALFLYERLNFQSAALFHATSAQELESIRQFGITQPVALIPNGVDLPEANCLDSINIFQRFSFPAGKRFFLFLSRVHPKKGVKMLLQEWRALSATHQNWHLIIAGDGEPVYLSELKKIIRDWKLQDKVSCVGFVEGADKSALFKAVDLFVLPTYSENFGISIAEALAHGVPVITTRKAPWKEIEDFQCGWWIEAKNEDLNQALTNAFKMSVKELQSMGELGKALVNERYSWKNISQKMADTYEWLLKKNGKPNCVIID